MKYICLNQKNRKNLVSEFDNNLDRIEQRIRDLENASKVTIKNAVEIKAVVVYKNKVKVYGDTMRNSDTYLMRISKEQRKDISSIC